MEPSYNPATPQLQEPPLKPSASPWLKKRLPWIIAVLVVLAGVLATSFYLNNQQVAAEDIEAAQVTIKTGHFSPGTIVVQKGANVIWTNRDDQPHKLLADNADLGLDSGEVLSSGDSFEFTFDKPGTYSYYDPLYANGFKGVVIVQ